MNIKPSVAVVLLGAILSQAAMAKPPVEWMALTRADGCIPLAELRTEFPEIQHHKTPTDIWNALKRKHPDTTIKPFVDQLSQDDQNGEPPNNAEKLFFEKFNRNNAFTIESKKYPREISLLTKALCQQLMKASDKT